MLSPSILAAPLSCPVHSAAAAYCFAIFSPSSLSHTHSFHPSHPTPPPPLLLGLWDPYNDAHMGNCAELCAEHYQISRQEMDDHAIETFQRAQAAAPFMQSELVPVQLPPSKAAPQGQLLDYDESLGKMNEAKLRGLKPFFKQVVL